MAFNRRRQTQPRDTYWFAGAGSPSQGYEGLWSQKTQSQLSAAHGSHSQQSSSHSPSHSPLPQRAFSVAPSIDTESVADSLGDFHASHEDAPPSLMKTQHVSSGKTAHLSAFSVPSTTASPLKSSLSKGSNRPAGYTHRRGSSASGTSWCSPSVTNTRDVPVGTILQPTPITPVARRTPPCLYRANSALSDDRMADLEVAGHNSMLWPGSSGCPRRQSPSGRSVASAGVASTRGVGGPLVPSATFPDGSIGDDVAASRISASPSLHTRPSGRSGSYWFAQSGLDVAECLRGEDIRATDRPLHWQQPQSHLNSSSNSQTTSNGAVPNQQAASSASKAPLTAAPLGGGLAPVIPPHSSQYKQQHLQSTQPAAAFNNINQFSSSSVNNNLMTSSNYLPSPASSNNVHTTVNNTVPDCHTVERVRLEARERQEEMHRRRLEEVSVHNENVHKIKEEAAYVRSPVNETYKQQASKVDERRRTLREADQEWREAVLRRSQERDHRAEQYRRNRLSASIVYPSTANHDVSPARLQSDEAAAMNVVGAILLRNGDTPDRSEILDKVSPLPTHSDIVYRHDKNSSNSSSSTNGHTISVGILPTVSTKISPPSQASSSPKSSNSDPFNPILNDPSPISSTTPLKSHRHSTCLGSLWGSGAVVQDQGDLMSRSMIVTSSAARRKTDLTPVTPSPWARGGRTASANPQYSSSRPQTAAGLGTPKRAVSMSRLDILAQPRRRFTMEDLKSRSHSAWKLNNTHTAGGTPTGTSGCLPLKSARSMSHLQAGPSTPVRPTRASQFRNKGHQSASASRSEQVSPTHHSTHTNLSNPPPHLRSRSQMSSDLSQSSVASSMGSPQANMRPKTQGSATRKARPLSIAGSIPSSELDQKKEIGMRKPHKPMPPSSSPDPPLRQKRSTSPKKNDSSPSPTKQIINNQTAVTPSASQGNHGAAPSHAVMDLPLLMTQSFTEGCMPIENRPAEGRKIKTKEEVAAEIAEARRKAREEAEKAAEEERRKRAEEEAAKKAILERRRQIEEEARLKREKEEEEKRLQEEAERKAEEERIRQEEELKRIEEEKAKAEAEAKKQREEAERAERKKRVEEIMARTRKAKQAAAAAAAAGGAVPSDSQNIASSGSPTASAGGDNSVQSTTSANNDLDISANSSANVSPIREMVAQKLIDNTDQQDHEAASEQVAQLITDTPSTTSITPAMSTAGITNTESVVSTEQNGLLNGHSGGDKKESAATVTAEEVLVTKTSQMVLDSSVLATKDSGVAASANSNTNVNNVVLGNTTSDIVVDNKPAVIQNNTGFKAGQENNVKNSINSDTTGQLMSIDNGPASTDSGTGSDFNSNNVVANAHHQEAPLIQDLVS